MADAADRAGEIIELSLSTALANRPALATPALHDECLDCGEQIPSARRQAAPWATTCIECQGIREEKDKHRSGAR